MLKGMKLMGAALAVGALATFAYAAIVTPPSVEINAPATWKVGAPIPITVQGTSGTNDFGESNGPISMVVTVTEFLKNGRTRTTTEVADNHQSVTVRVEPRGTGNVSAVQVSATVTVAAPEGPLEVHASTTTTIVTGNGNGNG